MFVASIVHYNNSLFGRVVQPVSLSARRCLSSTVTYKHTPNNNDSSNGNGNGNGNGSRDATSSSSAYIMEQKNLFSPISSDTTIQRERKLGNINATYNTFKDLFNKDKLCNKEIVNKLLELGDAVYIHTNSTAHGYTDDKKKKKNNQDMKVSGKVTKSIQALEAYFDSLALTEKDQLFNHVIVQRNINAIIYLLEISKTQLSRQLSSQIINMVCGTINIKSDKASSRLKYLKWIRETCYDMNKLQLSIDDVNKAISKNIEFKYTAEAINWFLYCQEKLSIEINSNTYKIMSKYFVFSTNSDPLLYLLSDLRNSTSDSVNKVEVYDEIMRALPVGKQEYIKHIFYDMIADGKNTAPIPPSLSAYAISVLVKQKITEAIELYAMLLKAGHISIYDKSSLIEIGVGAMVAKDFTLLKKTLTYLVSNSALECDAASSASSTKIVSKGDVDQYINSILQEKSDIQLHNQHVGVLGLILGWQLLNKDNEKATQLWQLSNSHASKQEFNSEKDLRGDALTIASKISSLCNDSNVTKAAAIFFRNILKSDDVKVSPALVTELMYIFSVYRDVDSACIVALRCEEQNLLMANDVFHILGDMLLEAKQYDIINQLIHLRFKKLKTMLESSGAATPPHLRGRRSVAQPYLSKQMFLHAVFALDGLGDVEGLVTLVGKDMMEVFHVQPTDKMINTVVNALYQANRYKDSVLFCIGMLSSTTVPINKVMLRTAMKSCAKGQLGEEALHLLDIANKTHGDTKYLGSFTEVNALVTDVALSLSSRDHASAVPEIVERMLGMTIARSDMFTYNIAILISIAIHSNNDSVLLYAVGKCKELNLSKTVCDNILSEAHKYTIDTASVTYTTDIDSKGYLKDFYSRNDSTWDNCFSTSNIIDAL